MTCKICDDIDWVCVIDEAVRSARRNFSRGFMIGLAIIVLWVLLHS
jgi:hypothetical protein